MYNLVFLKHCLKPYSVYVAYFVFENIDKIIVSCYFFTAKLAKLKKRRPIVHIDHLSKNSHNRVSFMKSCTKYLFSVLKYILFKMIFKFSPDILLICQTFRLMKLTDYTEIVISHIINKDCSSQ